MPLCGYDRLALLGADARGLQTALKDYTKARIDLYTMPEGFSLWQRTEVWSPEQQMEFGQQEQTLGCGDRRVPSMRYRVACSPRAAHTFQCL